jgi:hypothetical protein
VSALTPVPFRKGRPYAPRLSPPRVPGRRHERFWRDEELQVVREHYPVGGAPACKPHLPNRNVRQIYARARALGLKVEGLTPQRAYIPLPDDIDDRIRAAWPELKGRGAVSQLADALEVPRWWLSKRARDLGLALPHKKEPPWTPAEDALMRKVPLHAPERAAEIFRGHGFNRTPTAIVVRAKRLELSRRATRETYSGTAAARILGVDPKTLMTWCAAGEVRATRRDDLRLPQQGGPAWEITHAELRRFILENLERIDIRKVEKFAFVHVLTAETKHAAATPEPAARQLITVPVPSVEEPAAEAAEPKPPPPVANGADHAKPARRFRGGEKPWRAKPWRREHRLQRRMRKGTA